MQFFQLIAFCLSCLFFSGLLADNKGSCSTSKTFLVYGGKTGWIGQKLMGLLKEQNHHPIAGSARLENREELEREILAVKPDYILNAAGVTGTPNIDWCEDNKQTTIRTNIIGALNLFDVAFLHNIHVTNFGTGCIYEYDQGHPMASGIGFKEEESPNFSGSFYAETKGLLEKFLKSYPNVLNLRLRMPIATDLHPRNFISKITKYAKVISVPNSMTVLDDLLPVSIEMTTRELKGIYNFTNPGAISHNDILTLYKTYVDPAFTWVNFTIEEQDRILKARRSNNELDVTKLLAEFPDLPEIHESVQRVFQNIQKQQ